MAQPVARRILSRAKAQKAAQAQKEHQEFVNEFVVWKAQQTSTPIIVEDGVVIKDSVQLINDFHTQQEVTKAFNDALREIGVEQMQTSEDIFPAYLMTGPVGIRSYVVEEF